MPVYLIRHGQSEFNAVARDGIDPLIYDAPLTSLGQSQADRAREKIADLDIQHVICSPLTRAVQTALRIFKDTVPITVEAGHREMVCNSCDVGRRPDILSRDFPNLSFDHLDDHWWHKGRENEHGVPHEPEDIFNKRIEDFVTRLETTKIAPFATRPLAIVGHGLFFQGLIGRLMDNCEIVQYK
ncbi:histidine phosphatase family protein [uncultured Kiloniella sp.]|uniref:histidine phosphatase family protein n=1 Tax=uncultured Kiloniella sp. TaxID=1133091 RepID=UPI0026109232|nr:histidine phosphatase family protein [uncultured Kiloniella sp.]